MVNTNIQYYYTEVELVENTYSIFAQVNIEYTEEEHSDEHPYGNGTAIHNYTQLGIPIHIYAQLCTTLQNYTHL